MMSPRDMELLRNSRMTQRNTWEPRRHTLHYNQSQGMGALTVKNRISPAQSLRPAFGSAPGEINLCCRVYIPEHARH